MFQHKKNFEIHTWHNEKKYYQQAISVKTLQNLFWQNSCNLLSSIKNVYILHRLMGVCKLELMPPISTISLTLFYSCELLLVYSVSISVYSFYLEHNLSCLSLYTFLLILHLFSILEQLWSISAVFNPLIQHSTVLSIHRTLFSS